MVRIELKAQKKRANATMKKKRTVQVTEGIKEMDSTAAGAPVPRERFGIVAERKSFRGAKTRLANTPGKGIP